MLQEAISNIQVALPVWKIYLPISFHLSSSFIDLCNILKVKEIVYFTWKNWCWGCNLSRENTKIRRKLQLGISGRLDYACIKGNSPRIKLHCRPWEPYSGTLPRCTSTPFKSGLLNSAQVFNDVFMFLMIDWYEFYIISRKISLKNPANHLFGL